jgi:7-carboxy-7-deazaguanine synthase
VSLLVKELFRTIQGEGVFSGYPCTLVRLAGCNLRCTYCDTTYAYQGGRRYGLETLLGRIKSLGDDLVLVTGGEPLYQKDTAVLLQELTRSRAKVMLETNGSYPIKDLPRKIHLVMDLKCPGSGEVKANYWPNLKWLKPEDEVKFVLVDRRDYLWARNQIRKHSLIEKARINLSPAFGILPPDLLATWILKDRLPARLNLQIHKLVWKDGDRIR